MIVSEPRDKIKHDDVVQLIHGMTSRKLNSHDVAAPMSPQHQEVSCYIDYNISMASQDLWRVDLLNKDETDGYWHTIRSKVRLVHLNSSQALKVCLFFTYFVNQLIIINFFHSLQGNYCQIGDSINTKLLLIEF